mgnify:CR=1 FL=1
MSLPRARLAAYCTLAAPLAMLTLPVYVHVPKLYAEHYGLGLATQGVLLVAARPGSRWGQRLLASADAVCFWRGRIKFRGASAGAPFDSLFAAWNCRSRFVEAFAPHGSILERVS